MPPPNSFVENLHASGSASHADRFVSFLQRGVVNSHWQLVVLVELVLVEVVVVLVVVLVVKVVVFNCGVAFTVVFVVLVQFKTMSTITNGVVVFDWFVAFGSVVKVMVVVDVVVVEVVVVVVVDVVVVVVVVVVVCVIGQRGGRHIPSPVKRVSYSGHSQVAARRGDAQCCQGVPWSSSFVQGSCDALGNSPSAHAS